MPSSTSLSTPRAYVEDMDLASGPYYKPSFLIRFIRIHLVNYAEAKYQKLRFFQPTRETMLPYLQSSANALLLVSSWTQHHLGV